MRPKRNLNLSRLSLEIDMSSVQTLGEFSTIPFEGHTILMATFNLNAKFGDNKQTCDI